MKVLVSDPITESGLAILKKGGLEVHYLPEGSNEEIISASRDVHGWIIRSGTKILENFIENYCSTHRASNIRNQLYPIKH